jgi:hypothetical protein
MGRNWQQYADERVLRCSAVAKPITRFAGYMIDRTTKLLLAGAITLATCPAYAIDEPSIKAIDWLPFCKLLVPPGSEKKLSVKEAFQGGLCMGVLSGIKVAMTSMKYEKNPPWLCADIPEGVGVEQEARLVIKYLEDHPEMLHEDFRAMVMVVLGGQWPCRKPAADVSR